MKALLTLLKLNMKKSADFYLFLLKNIVRAIIYFAIIFGIYWVFKHYISDSYKEWLEPLTSRPLLILFIFFASETIFGIFPPEFFVIWASETYHKLFVFILFVALLSVISFAGATIAFYAGKRLRKTKIYRVLVLSSWNKYLKVYRKWGGAVIVISALTPLPYATISLISGAFGFEYKRYALFAASRFLRFILYGFIFWHGG